VAVHRVALALVIAALGAGCGPAAEGVDRSRRNDVTSLEGLGLRLLLPAGWSGRVYMRPYPWPGPITAQAGNFALPPDDDDRGTKAREVMPRDGILLLVSERVPGCCGGARVETLPPRVTRGDFELFEGVPTDHAAAVVHVRGGDRVFGVTAEFATREPSDAALRDANAVLATLEIGNRPELPRVATVEREVTVGASPATATVALPVLESAGEATVSIGAPLGADSRVVFRRPDDSVAQTVDSRLLGHDCEEGDRLGCETLLSGLAGRAGERWTAVVTNRSPSPARLRIEIRFEPTAPPPLFEAP
jgi:hypothetical protein